jgi:hypothetical protein
MSPTVRATTLALRSSSAPKNTFPASHTQLVGSQLCEYVSAPRVEATMPAASEGRSSPSD